MSNERPLIAPAIAVLASTPAVLAELLAPLHDDVIAAPGRDGWSARDVVAHLAMRQRAAIIDRVRAILDGQSAGTPRLPDVPAQLMDVAPFRSRPLRDLQREFEEGRRGAVTLLESVSAEQLGWRGVHSGIGEVSISDLVHHLAFHDLVHIAQAAGLVSARFEPLRGAMRAFR